MSVPDWDALAFPTISYVPFRDVSFSATHSSGYTRRYCIGPFQGSATGRVPIAICNIINNITAASKTYIPECKLPVLSEM